MGVTGIGTTYNYIYNVKTNKLSTKDGSRDEFVDFYNGDIDGKESQNLNHFDAGTRYHFERMLYLYSSGMTAQNPFDTAGDEVEITAEINSAAESTFYVNGQKAFCAYTGMTYTREELRTLSSFEQPFQTNGSRLYDPQTNSIHIGIGGRYELGGGYSVTVMRNKIQIEGNEDASNSRMNKLEHGLNALVRFADQQWSSDSIDMANDGTTELLLDFLQKQGVDTSREFIINGTHCEIRNGKIREVGNTYFVPSAIQQAALRRYEERMLEPLHDAADWGYYA